MIKSFNQRYGYSERDVLLVEELKESNLSEEQLAAVLDSINNICNHCWNEYKPCHCWRDE